MTVVRARQTGQDGADGAKQSAHGPNVLHVAFREEAITTFLKACR